MAGANLVVGIDDVDTTFAKGIELGASEAMAPHDMPGVGRLAYLIDPDGNIVGFISPLVSDGTDVIDASGPHTAAVMRGRPQFTRTDRWDK